jgi:hypothetical protein
MIELAVSIAKDATLVRFDQVARELSARGLEVRAKLPGLGIIIGTCEDRAVVAALRQVRDVIAVKERVVS